VRVESYNRFFPFNLFQNLKEAKVKYFCTTIALFLFLLVFNLTSFAAACDELPINGVYYTSKFCWVLGDGYISGTSQQNDTPRLQDAIDKSFGKLVFDEANYFINNDLTLHSYLIVEGTGRAKDLPTPLASPTPSPTPTPETNLSTKIVQTATGKSVFKIGADKYYISVRDMSLMASSTNGTVGILIENSSTNGSSSIGFQLSNLTISGFGKGVYVNAVAASAPVSIGAGRWQADNGRLDHVAFNLCKIGVHINSNNSGWSMSSLEFLVPPDTDNAGSGDANVEHETWGIYMQQSTYTNMNLVIGNGEVVQSTPPTDPPTYIKPSGFIRINHHGNVTIQNATDEPETFAKSLWVGLPGDPGDDPNLYLNIPVNVSNSFFGNEVKIDNTTYVSTANQYGGNGFVIPVDATGGSEIHSFGDKFCFEEDAPCIDGSSVDRSNFKLHDDAKLITSSTQKGAYFGIPVIAPLNVAGPYGSGNPLFSVMATDYAPTLLRLGRTSYWFDFTRSESDGALEINGNQTCCNAIRFKVGTSSQVQINPNGSVTYGSVTQSNLGTPANGTVVYCSDCTKATPCASGGYGALAKRVPNSGGTTIWDCD
jgi:hypothetical protein